MKASITPIEYAILSRRTAKRFGPDRPEFDLIHAALGLSSEAGELAEAWLRIDMTKIPQLDFKTDSPTPEVRNFLREIGDIYWFLCYAADTHIPKWSAFWSSDTPGGSDGFYERWLSPGLKDEIQQAWMHSTHWHLDMIAQYNPCCRLAVGHPYFSAHHQALSGAIANYTTLVKKNVVYGAEVPERAYFLTLVDVALCLTNMCKDLDIDPAMVWKDNISKLRDRYPEKYSDDLAIARLDEKTA